MLWSRDSCTLSAFLTHKISEYNDMVVISCCFYLEGFDMQQQETGASAPFQAPPKGWYHLQVGATVHSSLMLSLSTPCQQKYSLTQSIMIR